MSENPSIASRQLAGEALGSVWWFPLLRGILLLIVGIYALLRPGMTIGLLTQVVGIFIIFDGIFSIIAGIMGTIAARGWVIARGVLELLMGAFVYANPVIVAGITATVLIYVVALAVIVFGVLEIVAAIRDRKEIEGEGWLLLGGAIMVLFGVLLLIEPLSFGLIMVRVLGLFGIAAAVSLIGFSFRLRALGKRLRTA